MHLHAVPNELKILSHGQGYRYVHKPIRDVVHVLLQSGMSCIIGAHTGLLINIQIPRYV
jgi:hypothetical protein